MTDTTPEMKDALAEWTGVLGPEQLILDGAVLDQWQTATFATSQRIPAVLRPDSVEQAAACVAIANRHRVPIYPISRGRNWGLGSRVPVKEAVVLDLSRLNRIVAFDERFGCLTLEPGVTFQQAHEYLTECSSAWFLPVIGGPADASVLGNCIERGDTAGPRQDRLAQLYSLEVILASGEIVHTGFERFGETPLTPLSAVPAGPYLDGLFTQSNLGIITRATVTLTRLPQQLQMVQASITEGGLAAFVDALQPLSLQLEGNATFALWNGHKLHARTLGKTPSALSAEGWFFNAGLYAPSALMAAAQRELALNALTACSQQLQCIDETSTPNLREQAGLLLGVPSNENVRSLYLRKPGPIPEDRLDPDRDRCGALWLCPEVPFDGAAVAAAVATCERILGDFQYAPVLAVQVRSTRTVRMFISIFYDRDTPGEDERAMQCHDELLAALNMDGFFPFRLGVQSMGLIDTVDEPFWNLLYQVKTSMDPKHILAPGRYGKGSIRNK